MIPPFSPLISWMSDMWLLRISRVKNKKSQIKKAT
jgi:hypothetical protein